jgi:hypothetical protein
LFERFSLKMYAFDDNLSVTHVLLSKSSGP